MFFVCLAVLSPLSQSIKEMEMLLASPSLRSLLKESETIEEISRVDNGFWVQTDQTKLYVEIEYLPHKQIGPKPFRLHFHPVK